MYGVACACMVWCGVHAWCDVCVCVCGGVHVCCGVLYPIDGLRLSKNIILKPRLLTAAGIGCIYRTPIDDELADD